MKDEMYGWFMPSETKCKSGAPGDIKEVLRIALNKWRDEYGKPIHIVSGYRSPAYNKKVGGSPSSLHMQGLAADIRLPSNKYDRDWLLTTSFSVGFTGRGFYRSFIHVDLRDIAGLEPAYWVGS